MYFFVYTPSNQHFKAFLDHTWIHCTQRAQAKTMPSVHTSSQFYIQTATSMPRGFTCARKLRYTGFTIVQLDTY